MGRGSPTLAAEAKLEWKGRSAAKVCTSAARKIGKTLASGRVERFAEEGGERRRAADDREETPLN